MRIVVISMLIIVNFILESTVFQYLRIYGIKPDFMLFIIVSYAILRGSGFGAFVGLGTGLLVDLMYGRVFGANALSYMLTGYLIGQAHENVFKDSFVPAVIFNFLAVVVSQHISFLIYYFSNNIEGTGITYIGTLLGIILPQGIYNAILGGVAYRYLYRLDKKSFMDIRIY